MNSGSYPGAQEMKRRLTAHYDALVKRGHEVTLDETSDNCLHVDSGLPGTTIDVWVVDLTEPQEESEVTITKTTSPG